MITTTIMIIIIIIPSRNQQIFHKRHKKTNLFRTHPKYFFLQNTFRQKEFNERSIHSRHSPNDSTEENCKNFRRQTLWHIFHMS